MAVFVLIMVVLLAGYAIGRRLTNEHVICVEAGPINSVSAEALRRKSFYAPRTDLLLEGDHHSMKDMIRVVVSGNCMEKRSIKEGTQLYVERINKDVDVTHILEKGDILMLYLPDSKKYKIREFDSFTEDGALKTYFYNPDGTVHESRHPHQRSTLIGVVKYRV